MARRLSPSHRLLLAAAAGALSACAGRTPPAPAPEASLARADARAIAVYRTIAESIYVRSTNRVVAVAEASLDSTCAGASCPELAARWGLQTLWWAKDDSTEARDARADLLGRATMPLDMRTVPTGRPMLFAADPGDVPAVDASVQEWLRFRATHADAAGAIRVSPVGFSRSGRSAIAFVDWRCGPTCGHQLGVALRATSDTSWAIDDMLLLRAEERH